MIGPASTIGFGLLLMKTVSELEQPFFVTVTAKVLSLVIVGEIELDKNPLLQRYDELVALACNVTLEPSHTAWSGPRLTRGLGVTCTVISIVDAAHGAWVTVTRYEVVVNGLTLIDSVVSLVLHLNESPFGAEIEMVSPGQMGEGAGTAVNGAETGTTRTESRAVQPLFVTETMYVAG